MANATKVFEDAFNALATEGLVLGMSAGSNRVTKAFEAQVVTAAGENVRVAFTGDSFEVGDEKADPAELAAVLRAAVVAADEAAEQL